MDNTNFHEKSYQLQEHTYAKFNLDAELKMYDNWFDRGTTDVWRHLRMLENIDPFLNYYHGAEWLTIGDGRFGTSAIYINRKKGNALATDIDVSLLEVAKNKNWISSYKYANAENLPFDDNAFDFSFCKEAYHHFPRAYIGIYEMLRVSRKAVILVEPSDWLPSPIPRRILQMLKNGAKKKFHMAVPHPDSGGYETTGNYVFTIGARDIQKIALGLQLPYVAYKRFHDVYIRGVEQEKMSASAPLYRSIKKKISQQSLQCKLGLNSLNQIAAVFFKETPPSKVMEDFSKMGFTIIALPQNPYLK